MACNAVNCTPCKRANFDLIFCRPDNGDIAVSSGRAEVGRHARMGSRCSEICCSDWSDGVSAVTTTGEVETAVARGRD
jgi:hypothetical protein